MEALIFIALSWSIGSGSCWQRASFIVFNAQKRAYCVRPRVAILHDWKQWQFLSFVSHWFQNVNIRCVSFYLFFNTRARGRFVCVTAYHLSRLWLGNFSIASKIGPIGRTHRSIAGICRCVLCVCDRKCHRTIIKGYATYKYIMKWYDNNQRFSEMSMICLTKNSSQPQHSIGSVRI